jgi:hypothetical protein
MHLTFSFLAAHLANGWDLLIVVGGGLMALVRSRCWIEAVAYYFRKIETQT